jgi:hypothetical protein
MYGKRTRVLPPSVELKNLYFTTTEGYYGSKKIIYSEAEYTICDEITGATVCVDLFDDGIDYTSDKIECINRVFMYATSAPAVAMGHYTTSDKDTSFADGRDAVHAKIHYKLDDKDIYLDNVYDDDHIDRQYRYKDGVNIYSRMSRNNKLFAFTSTRPLNHLKDASIDVDKTCVYSNATETYYAAGNQLGKNTTYYRTQGDEALHTLPAAGIDTRFDEYTCSNNSWTRKSITIDPSILNFVNDGTTVHATLPIDNKLTGYPVHPVFSSSIPANMTNL